MELATVVLVVAAAAALIAWFLPSLERWFVTASAVAAVLAAAEVVRRIRAGVTKYAGPAWRAAVRMGEGQLQGLLTAADVAAAEVDALEGQLRDLTAAGQLAGLVAERSSAGSYRGRLGVMTQIREDFARMADLLAQAEPATQTWARARRRRQRTPMRSGTHSPGSTGSSCISMIWIAARRTG